MKQLVFVFVDPERTTLPAELSDEARRNNICVVLLSPDRFRARQNEFDAADTLVVTDSEEIIKTCKTLGLPVVGFEHDGIRLSCGEILLSTEDLTLADYLQYFESLSGREILWQNNDLSLRKMSEDTFVRFFALFRSEAFFLTEEEQQTDESSVRSLYQSRALLASLSRGFGPAEAILTEPDGSTRTVGCVAAFEEPLNGSMKLTIEYYIIPEERGKGLGKRLVNALTEACAKYLPNTSLYAVVHPDNAASLATLKACTYLTLPANPTEQTAPQSPARGVSHRFRESQAPVLLVHYPNGHQ